MTWGWYDEGSDRTSINITNGMFLLDTESTAVEGMREDLKAKFLAIINFFLTSEENRDISSEKLCEVYSLLENHFNMIETVTSIDKANEVKIAAITMLGLGIGHLIVNIMLIAIGSAA